MDYIDRDKLIEMLQTDYTQEGVNADKFAMNGSVDLSVKYSHGQFCYLNAIERTKNAPTEDVVPRAEVERLSNELLDKDIEMKNEVHRLEAYIEQIEKEAEDWESVAVNREARINKLQSILLQFTDIVHKWGAKHNFDTTEISLVPILEQEANSIIDQAKQEVAKQIFDERATEEEKSILRRCPFGCQMTIEEEKSWESEETGE